MISRMLKVAVVAAAVSGFAGSAGLADECDDITKAVRNLVDKIEPDKAKGNQPLTCAIYAEGLGMLKLLRVVSGECLEEDSKRAPALAELERTIRSLQSQVIDRNCG